MESESVLDARPLIWWTPCYVNNPVNQYSIPNTYFLQAKMKLLSIGFKKKVLAMLHILKYITQGSLPGLGKWTWWHERSVTKTQTWVDMSSKLVFLSPCLSSSHLVWSFLALFLCLLASSALWWLEVRMLWNFSACIYLWWAHWFFSKKYINYNL